MSVNDLDMVLDVLAQMASLAWRAFWSYWMWHLMLAFMIVASYVGVMRGDLFALPFAVLFSLGLGASWGLSVLIVVWDDFKGK